MSLGAGEHVGMRARIEMEKKTGNTKSYKPCNIQTLIIISA